MEPLILLGKNEVEIVLNKLIKKEEFTATDIHRLKDITVISADFHLVNHLFQKSLISLEEFRIINRKLIYEICNFIPPFS